MADKQKTKMNWPTNQDAHAHMRHRQGQNRKQAERNAAENWMLNHLKQTGYKWTRQAQSGFRLFDFWNHQLGIAVEVDGPSHNSEKVREKDRIGDEETFRRRGIVTLRVRNWSEEDAWRARRAILVAESWNERRTSLGLEPVLNADKRG